MDVPAGRSQKIFPFTGLQSRTMERISQSNRPGEARLESAVIGWTQVDFYGFLLYLPLSGAIFISGGIFISEEGLQ